MADKEALSRQPEEPAKPPAQPAPKSDTSRIDLADAEPSLASSVAGEPMSVKDVLRPAEAPPKPVPARPVTTVVRAVPASGPKTTTSRVSLDEAKNETSAIAGAAKDATVRVDLTSVLGKEGASAPDRAVSSKPPSEVRIRAAAISPTPPADETSHIKLDVGGQATSEETSRIQLDANGQVTADETTHIVLHGGPPPSAAPKTVRLQRPSTLPKTVVLPKPSEPTPTAPPKTVVLKKPGEEAEATKGATSRIAVPDGVVQAGPVTQRKTIRIKRPDTVASPSGGKTLVIARPSRPVSVALPASAEEQADEIAKEMHTEKNPGAVFAILALAAVLVAAVLTYILAAQTFAPTLPFPGRLM